MQLVTRRWMQVVPLSAALSIGWALPMSASPQQADTQGAARTEANGEGIREHIDEAEDIVERLLDWRPAVSAVRTGDNDKAPPMNPATTLIAVDRTDVERLSSLLDAAAVMAPLGSVQGAATAPRGDLAAHIAKAQEIARELMPSAAAKPVGTSGGTVGKVVVDRSALQRLDIEIDAAELVAPRQLK